MREGRLVGSIFPELTFTLQDIYVIEQQREGGIRVIWNLTKSLSSTTLMPFILFFFLFIEIEQGKGLCLLAVLSIRGDG